MDPAAPALPPVVAVMLTRNPGPAFEVALASLRVQDYPALSVLVLDAASDEDPTERVAAVAPGAFVRRLLGNDGWGAAVNHVGDLVEGASFYLFCHDDVALDPGAVRALVEEAFRSNAGIVAPKVLDWDEPERIRSLGLTTDRTAVTAPLVEPGELDQGQHDQARDVFVAPGGVTLVRADLFEALGGYDPGITFLGDDVELSWRAWLAGARVVVAPEARVRHREQFDEHVPDPEERRRLATRHRLRTVLVCQRLVTLVWLVPWAFLLSLGEALYAVFLGRFHHARVVLAAWPWNLRRLGQVVRRRRSLTRSPTVTPHDIRRLQVKGSARVQAFLRGQVNVDDRFGSVSAAGRSLARVFTDGARRTVVLTWAAVALVALFGSRTLLTEPLPLLGEFAPFPSGPGSLWAEFWSGWRSAGLGSPTPAPTAFALLSVAGAVLLGAMGLLQKILVLGLVPLGLVGAWRLPVPFGSRRARLAALVVYAAVPLPWNALASGGWSVLMAYAAVPWVLGALARVSDLAPWGRVPDGEPTGAEVPPRRRAPWWRMVALGLGLGVLVAFLPGGVFLAPLVGVGLVLGSLVAGGLAGALRALVVAVGASIVAVVLNLPWSSVFVVGLDASVLFGAPETARTGVSALVRFETGPLGAAPLGWLYLLVAAVPLAIGTGWRLGWAIRAWGLVAVGVLAAALGTHDVTGVGTATPEVWLTVAAAGAALAAALGMEAFETDLPGRHFGWRQVVAVGGGVALALAVVPVVGRSFDGSWGAPVGDFGRSLSFLGSEAAQDKGEFRVLWIGEPSAVPAGSWELAPGLVYATSLDGPPDVTNRWPGPSGGAVADLGEAIRMAARGDTARFGRLVGPMGVRYVVVPLRPGPELTGLPTAPVPPELLTGLASQLDLERVVVDRALVVYENLSWVPVRAGLTPGQTEAVAAAEAATGGSFTAAARVDLAGAPPVLGTDAGATTGSGPVADGSVWLAASSDENWQLTVAGVEAPRAEGLGWANRFATVAGDAQLSYRRPASRLAGIALEVVLVVAALYVLRRGAARPVPRPARSAAPAGRRAAGAASRSGGGAAPPARRSRARAEATERDGGGDPGAVPPADASTPEGGPSASGTSAPGEGDS